MKINGYYMLTASGTADWGVIHIGVRVQQYSNAQCKQGVDRAEVRHNPTRTHPPLTAHRSLLTLLSTRKRRNHRFGVAAAVHWGPKRDITQLSTHTSTLAEDTTQHKTHRRRCYD